MRWALLEFVVRVILISLQLIGFYLTRRTFLTHAVLLQCFLTRAVKWLSLHRYCHWHTAVSVCYASATRCSFRPHWQIIWSVSTHRDGCERLLYADDARMDIDALCACACLRVCAWRPHALLFVRVIFNRSNVVLTAPFSFLATVPCDLGKTLFTRLSAAGVQPIMLRTQYR